MTRLAAKLSFFAIAHLFLAFLGTPAETTAIPSIAEKTLGMQKLPGYFNLYWDAKQGKLWLEIDKWGKVIREGKIKAE